MTGDLEQVRDRLVGSTREASGTARRAEPEFSDAPEGWSVASLGDVAAIRAGGTPYRGSPAYWGGEVPWVTTAEINGSTITEAHEYITALGLERSAARLEEPGTVLVALYGQGPTRGRVATLAIRAATNQACAAVITRAGLLPQFLFHYLAGSYQRLRSLSNKGSQDNLSGVLLKTFPVLVPPLTEQRAIATALSDVDGLLEALEALIAKKRAIKKAAMQQLLTGKSRLPGFTGEWETKRLGEFGSTYGGLTGKTKADFGNGHARYITFLNVLENVLIDPQGLDQVRVEAHETQNPVRKGDVLFNGTSETAGDLAMAAVMGLDQPETYLNSFCFGLRLHPHAECVPRFLASYFRGSPGRRVMFALAQGATRYNVSKAQFVALELTLPQYEEQAAIATVLSDMDAEIEALEFRCDKTRAIKQGMMQQLLAGHVRLVEPEAAA